MNHDTAREFVSNLLRLPLDMEAMAANSWGNYHAVGVTYLNLLRTPKLTVKVYLCDPLQVRHNEQGHLVVPHSHRYNFHTFVLHGSMNNITFVPKAPVDSHYLWNKWKYVSPFATCFKSIEGDGHDYYVQSKRLLGVGDSYYLTTDQIHTIQVDKTEVTCLVLFQYGDHPEIMTTTMLSKDRYEPNCTSGLYVPMDIDSLQKPIQLLRRIIV